MRLANQNLDFDYKEQWIEFRLNNELLTAYTAKGSFKTELEETINILAYENECERTDIKIKKVYR